MAVAHRVAPWLPALLAGLQPALESAGDWELVTELTGSALARGSSAARQRAARASGGLRNVVDTLVAETRATPMWLRGTGPARATADAGGPMRQLVPKTSAGGGDNGVPRPAELTHAPMTTVVQQGLPGAGFGYRSRFRRRPPQTPGRRDEGRQHGH